MSYDISTVDTLQLDVPVMKSQKSCSLKKENTTGRQTLEMST